MRRGAILEAAERLDALGDDAARRARAWDDTVGRSYVYAYRLAGVLYALDHWLSLPWRCRLTGHDPQRRVSYESNTGCVEEAWLECARCGHFLSYLPEGVCSPRAGASPGRTVRS